MSDNGIDNSWLQKCDLAHAGHLVEFFCSRSRKVIGIQFDVTESETDCEIGIVAAVEGSSFGMINLTCGARGSAVG